MASAITEIQKTALLRARRLSHRHQKLYRRETMSGTGHSFFIAYRARSEFPVA